MAKEQEQQKTLIGGLDNFARKNNKLFVILSMLLFLILSFLSFDIKQSINYDDAQYVVSGIRTVIDFPNYIYLFHGPLYTLFISLIYIIFGSNLFIMKLTSIIFVVASIPFLNKLLQQIEVSPFVALITIFTYAFNFYVIHYSHYTYTEPAFFFFQFMFLYFYLKYLPKEEDKIFNFRLKVFLTGTILGVMVFTRSVAYAAIPLLIIFHLFYKKRWNHFLNAFAGFVSVYALYTIVKKLLWSAVLAHTNKYGQLLDLLRKDPYNPSKGLETFTGYFGRFFGNFQLYISKRLFDIFGYTPNALTTNTLLSIITAILLILAFRYIYKNKQYKMLSLWLYTIGLSGFMFIILQTRWDQLRLILILAPFFFLLLFEIIRQFVVKKSYVLQLIFFILICIPPFINLKRDFNEVSQQLPVVMQNLHGEPLAGYTPDWQNYIGASEWCAHNLPQNSIVLTRKAAISYIYGKGKIDFRGIYSLPSENPDTLMNYLFSRKIQYVIIGSLRRNPKMKTQYVINTLRRFFYFTTKKYPKVLTKLYTAGNDEVSAVYKVNYPPEF